MRFNPLSLSFLFLSSLVVAACGDKAAEVLEPNAPLELVFQALKSGEPSAADDAALSVAEARRIREIAFPAFDEKTRARALAKNERNGGDEGWSAKVRQRLRSEIQKARAEAAKQFDWSEAVLESIEGPNEIKPAFPGYAVKGIEIAEFSVFVRAEDKRFEFRAPGTTRIDGKWYVGSVYFTGPADADPDVQVALEAAARLEKAAEAKSGRIDYDGAAKAIVGRAQEADEASWNTAFAAFFAQALSLLPSKEEAALPFRIRELRERTLNWDDQERLDKAMGHMGEVGNAAYEFGSELDHAWRFLNRPERKRVAKRFLENLARERMSQEERRRTMATELAAPFEEYLARPGVDD
ncbi:MAG: hypothetical protein GY946_21425 [bacterium]|nr:hypothetical protein [bacterium]